MKKNGFTLIELLAVIIILGFLLMITIPSILSVKDSGLESLNQEQKRNIEEAAKILALDLDDYLSDVYNCNSSSWVRIAGKCVMSGDGKKWQEVDVLVDDLVEHDYFSDDQKHCSGLVKISKTGSPYKIEFDGVTCQK